jgi:cereblon
MDSVPEIATGTVSDEKEEPSTLLRCRFCETVVGSEDDLFCMRATTPIQAFPNPAGILYEILTLGDAHNLIFVGPPTTEFTWFTGYAWDVAHCAACTSHLGWRYLQVSPSPETPCFFGLLRAQVVSR